MIQTQTPDCDALIVGAGMIGGACGLALARQGLNVSVIDRDHLNQDAKAEPRRVSAINLASENILRRLEVWDEVLASLPQTFERIEVQDEGSSGTISFDAADLGLTHLGHIISNEAITGALHHSLNKEQCVSLRLRQAPIAIDSSDSSVTVTLETGEMISARILIGADGANSRVRELASITHQQSSYEHMAIVATVKPELPHASCARQRFLASGPLAFLPLANNECSIVWSANTETAEQLLALEDEAFSLELADAFEYRLGRIQKVSPRAWFPLVRRHAVNYIGERIALIGDAAHTVHPLAGLGANQGFADAATLFEVISNAALQNRDLGSRSVLRRYERWRRGENTLVLKVMDGFHGLFGTDNPALLRLRGLGLNLTDNAPLIKETLVRYAVGLEGDLPQLAQMN